MNNRYMSNNIERNATLESWVYCRLSKDDELTERVPASPTKGTFW